MAVVEFGCIALVAGRIGIANSAEAAADIAAMNFEGTVQTGEIVEIVDMGDAAVDGYIVAVQTVGLPELVDIDEAPAPVDAIAWP